jgi:hypothetical protein
MLSSAAGELVTRFVIGGAIVSVFAVIAKVCRPKSFAGLFGAAPSVALTTIGISIVQHGKHYASTEARSMVFGAMAFLVYAVVESWIMMRYKTRALATTSTLLPLWLGVSLAVWWVASR